MSSESRSKRKFVEFPDDDCSTPYIVSFAAYCKHKDGQTFFVCPMEFWVLMRQWWDTNISSDGHISGIAADWLEDNFAAFVALQPKRLRESATRLLPMKVAALRKFFYAEDRNISYSRGPIHETEMGEPVA